MQALTEYGQQKINDISMRYNLSQDAVMYMLQAVVNGNGTMAQFNCPELGGSGQWMQGGMTMVGDMFNYGLQSTVSNLCSELSTLISSQQSIFLPPPPSQKNNYMSFQNNWWLDSEDLGIASSTGSQNSFQYAIFPETSRLAIRSSQTVTIYDTLDHLISGISQQQGSGASISFSSQYGLVYLSQLPIVSINGTRQQGYLHQDNTFNEPPAQQVSTQNNNVVNADSSTTAHNNNGVNGDSSAAAQNNNGVNGGSSAAAQNNNGVNGGSSPTSTEQESNIINTIERLASLKEQGILSEDEFVSKKAELLQRL